VDVTAERRTGGAGRLPKTVGVAIGILTFLMVIAVGLAALFAGAAALVWATGLVGSWLGLPATPMLVAAIGIVLCVLVLIAYARIVEAIREPFRSLGDLTDVLDPDDYDDEEGSDDGDDGEGVTSSARRRT
jgi:hypothetical protein